MIPEKQNETNIRKLQQILSRPFYKAQNYTLGAIQKSLCGYYFPLLPPWKVLIFLENKNTSLKNQ
jgi:hypothetical protein